MHGFDEFFGNLYHLNAEDEPESIPTIRRAAEFRLRFGPRGVSAMHGDHGRRAGEDPRFGAWGKQNCEDTGPLDSKRMETVDEEFLNATLGFMDKCQAARPAVLRLVQRDADAYLDAARSRSRKARPASASIPTAWSSMTAWWASC